MSIASEAANVLGQVLSIPFYETFADGVTVATGDGGRLVFQAKDVKNPADGPPSVNANCVAAVSALPNRQSDEPSVFALTTALCDADGRLWQRTRRVSIYEIWTAILEQPVLYALAELPSEDPMYRNAETVTRRVLIEPVPTLADQREQSLVEIIRESGSKTEPLAENTFPYENAKRLLFRFRFKYFGAMIGLIEDRPVFRIRNTGQLSCSNRFLVTVRPMTDADLIAALDRHDRLLPGEEIRLCNLPTLCSRDTRLQPRWGWPTWDPPMLGEVSVWQRALRDAGAQPLTFRAFDPNPSIRYEPQTKSL